jgi:hypothetical protein
MAKRFILALTAFALAFPSLAHSEVTFLPSGDQPSDYFVEVGKGNVAGSDLMAKFGENPSIAAAAGFEVVWDAGGDYVVPTAPSLHNIVSSLAADAGQVVSGPSTATGGSVTTLVDSEADFVTDSVVAGDRVLNDTTMMSGIVSTVDDLNTITLLGTMTSPDTGLEGTANSSGDSYRIVRDASTGASILHIAGLGSTRLEQEEFVVLNGVGIVATTKLWSRQHRARIFATAATDAAGTITSTAQSGGTVTLQVINGNNQTLMAVYTCPSNMICYIIKWWGSLSKTTGGGAVAIMNLRAGTLDGVGYIVQTRAMDNAGSSNFTYDYAIPIAIPGGADVWVEADTTSLVGVSSGFDIIKVNQ